MTTLKELNGKVWYRFLKVIFILCYIPYILLLFIVIHEGGRDYHEPILPDSVKEILKDPEFYKLDNDEMRTVISSIESKSIEPKVKIKDTIEQKNVRFNDMSVDDQLVVIDLMKEKPTPTKPISHKYEYKPFYTYNIMKCVLYGLISLICYILVMECIRRGFYYIVIGKVFPKE